MNITKLTLEESLMEIQNLTIFTITCIAYVKNSGTCT